MPAPFAPESTVTVQYHGNVDGLPFKLERYSDDGKDALLRGLSTGRWWCPTDHLRDA